MKKTIYMTMTSERARERGFEPHLSLAHRPVEIDLDAMSPVARWIAEHITATRVLDEARDVIPVYAVAGFSMAERDRRAGRSEAYINRMVECYGDYYTQAMRTDGISFPIYGRSHHRPEDVIEQTARCVLWTETRAITPTFDGVLVTRKKPQTDGHWKPKSRPTRAERERNESAEI